MREFGGVHAVWLNADVSLDESPVRIIAMAAVAKFQEKVIVDAGTKLLHCNESP